MESLVFDWIKAAILKGVWYSLAVITFMLITWPEILMSMELMAIIELLGALIFVLMYASGLKLFFTCFPVSFN